MSGGDIGNLQDHAKAAGASASKGVIQHVVDEMSQFVRETAVPSSPGEIDHPKPRLVVCQGVTVTARA